MGHGTQTFDRCQDLSLGLITGRRSQRSLQREIWTWQPYFDPQVAHDHIQPKSQAIYIYTYKIGQNGCKHADIWTIFVCVWSNGVLLAFCGSLCFCAT